MNMITCAVEREIAVVSLQRGKVNAINFDLIDELATIMKELSDNDDMRAVVLTGSGKFFSFGFDLPELVTYNRDQLREFLTSFVKLKSDLFLLCKPLVAAINGHATAGGCMLALTADYRVMTDSTAKIALNEVNLGVPVFAGTIAMLGQAVGRRVAEQVLMSGQMYSPEEACRMGMVDRLAAPDSVLEEAVKVAQDLGGKPTGAFVAIKQLLRQELIERANAREPELIERFMDHWFSPETQKILKSVEIRQ